MNEMDGRKRSHEAREEIRIRAVKRVEAGESPEVVIEALGFHRSAIYRWIALYREGDIEALKRRKAAGPAPKLNGQQLRRLSMMITASNPLPRGFEFALCNEPDLFGPRGASGAPVQTRESVRSQYR